MKKLITLLLVLSLVMTLAACGTGEKEGENTDIKIGVILVHDENTGYDYAHIQGIKAATAAAGFSDDQIIWKYNISEDENCYDTATDLVDQGCAYIISDSYGHQSYMQQAASENPNTTFIAMTGDTAALSGLPNFKNAFNYTFESRYVSGVVAGMKLAELIEDGMVAAKNMDADGNIKMGYVGAFPYAEVVSGYTGFYLGVKSVVENVVMDVTYTNSWYDPTAEAEAANSLVSDGCIIISQHADSTGAPSACEALLAGGTTVYCVGYNVDMLSVAPTSALTSAQNDWGVYYTYAFNNMKNGTEIATDWASGYADGAVMISALGASCADGTAEKVAEVEAGLKDGSINVFDTSTFTVGGETVTSYMAIDTDGDWVGDTGEAITNGIFNESTLRSAPYFGLRIDGITELNAG
ncbi:MAG TPA: BMP family ABC transporter substrate-binding protein [Clostridia bacterium]|nr:BMP family ABC transporter substrate-binding protein [Clostridia bacterium]HPQ47274.1 BMP family ABC transporter substrate-binding protein [Clostridia bacterium]HRX42937.1 BMP family ABC transporter substrate-binding protein [Clostridia bacterium]